MSFMLSFRSVDFSFVSSSTQSLSKFSNILKIARMFKLVRRFPSAQVIIYVFSQAWKELIRFYFFMILFACCAGVLLFDVNRAIGCFVDETCPVAFDNSPTAALFSKGEEVQLTDQNNFPVYYNGMYGVWFVLVTMTTGKLF